MAIKAKDVMKKKPSTEDKSKKGRNGTSLMAWIGGRRGSSKKGFKAASKNDKDEED